MALLLCFSVAVEVRSVVVLVKVLRRRRFHVAVGICRGTDPGHRHTADVAIGKVSLPNSLWIVYSSTTTHKDLLILHMLQI